MIKQTQNQYTGLTQDKHATLPESSTMLDLDTGEFFYVKNGELAAIRDPEAITTSLTKEPAGAAKVTNIVAMTQAECDAAGATVLGSTLYLITD